MGKKENVKKKKNGKRKKGEKREKREKRGKGEKKKNRKRGKEKKLKIKTNANKKTNAHHKLIMIETDSRNGLGRAPTYNRKILRRVSTQLYILSICHQSIHLSYNSHTTAEESVDSKCILDENKNCFPFLFLLHLLATTEQNHQDHLSYHL